MAELARNYHNDLQKEGTDDTSERARTERIKDLLNQTKPLEYSPELQDLTEHISEQCIKDALLKTQTGKASGLDGIPYELWTTLQKIHAQTDESEASFNVLALLEILYNDINRYGIEENCEFTDGWMCPLYKKKDRRDIANYRPITLLNTDYKLYTRILATRLAPVASTIIHNDQAGFLPGRKISDQTQLCRVMVDYAEATEENGAIIALDQEKAYDKILHGYLWTTLEAMGLPTKFINWIKNLYQHATTIVIINGERSTPFIVTRGVRQGDPLSCLLFDLAIEPLACAIRASNLQGFRAPGMAERLVASLFADDTSTFLSQNDKWSDLWAVLDNWCEASGARFNKGKTEVVPIGTTEYRQSVITTRKLNQHADEPGLPDFIHIASDGEPVRMLGAWIGNKTDQAAIWAPAIHKVNAFLERWKRCHPTMKGKRNIIQMGPGGITQYLSEVQGMPKEIEDTLTKMIRHFIWDSDRPPPVNMETLCRPIEEGGLGILDIKARNEAIDLMWLKRYLTLTPDRPRWAFLVDTILAIRVTKEAGQIKRNAQINTFLQDWHPATHSRSQLPVYLKRLLTTAKKHNACFAAVKLGPSVKLQLPAWYHISADKHLRRLNNTRLSNCLRDNHNVRVVADLLKASQHPPFIQSGQPGKDYDCTCEACNNTRNGGCKHPMKCQEAAARITNSLSAKWNPKEDNIPDGLTLTAKRKEHNEGVFEEGGTATFDPSLTTRSGVSEAIRVFVEEETITKAPAIRQRQGRTVPAEAITVYVINAPKQPARGGTRPKKAQSDGRGFAYYAKNDPRNNLVQSEQSGRVEEESWAEATAALYAAQSTPLDAPLNIVGETNYLTKELIQKIHKSEDRGWLNVPNQALLCALANLLRQRCAPTTFRTASTREEQQDLIAARREATEARQRSDPKPIEMKMNPIFNLSGVRLSTLTQKLAYQHIRDRKAVETRRATQRTMSKIIERTREQPGAPSDPAGIWNGIRVRDIRRNIQDFLWKCTHDAHKCGKFWESVPGYEERGTCHTCGATDSMNHILTKCKAPGQDAIWKMAGNLWKRKKLRWAKPSTEDILTAGTREWKHETGREKRRPRAERLWRILVTESAFLIWKLRCERVISHSDDENWHHTEPAIRTRWTRMVNERLHLDMAMTHRRFGRKALKRSEVLGTWQGTLRDELALPDDWTALNWVLVGIEAAH
ncbi:hypothetical protein EVJ58_g4350 [Rhodofomes roseus]|uniref:Reverse transcriptase domain-containing protein n=1 Tax=Rhodofomes roseus TaxID=34475 RepID=A0A4Y9YGL2_9APHY|nr:hypothetical protein EVJ58_g4350 [Rhodofomes roseus]